MTPKAEPSTDLLEARTIAEQDWAHARWLERCSWSRMRMLANRSVKKGGLGYDLSESALKGLVRGAREARGDLSMTKEERAERALAELDDLGALARASLGTGAKLGVVDHDSAKLLLAVQKREADIVGYDAAARVDVTVTTQDAVQAELDAMLERAGRKPIERETPKP